MRAGYDPSKDLADIERFVTDAAGYAAAAKVAIARSDEGQAASHIRALIDVCDFAFSRSELVLRMLGYAPESGRLPRHPSA